LWLFRRLLAPLYALLSQPSLNSQARVSKRLDLALVPVVFLHHVREDVLHHAVVLDARKRDSLRSENDIADEHADTLVVDFSLIKVVTEDLQWLSYVK
jgi:spore coat polysaccharide biosynthesis predicted glycosyltransferase SpsG